MGDASLSQEEIDALLMGADEVEEEQAFPDTMSAARGGNASAGYDDLIIAFNEAMATASKSASSLVNKTINIIDLAISDSSKTQASSEIFPKSIIIDIDMGSHKTAMVVEESVAKRISMYMMCSNTEPEFMDEAYLSTLGELANTVLSSLSNNLGRKFKDDLTPSSPTAKVYNGTIDLPGFSNNSLKKFEYDLLIDTDVPEKLVHYIEEDAVERWNSSLSGSTAAPPPQMGMQAESNEMEQQPTGQMTGGYQMGAKKDYSGGSVNINPVSYPSLTAGGMKGQMPSNIDLLLDVQMILTVELGRTKKYVKDILGLGEGSIIELDKLAGEPVDLLVNGKLIAKGEVVVIDENFGVRVTDIVGPAERLARLSGGE
jgi:flagellar motor switch protein FliN/FliY